MPVPTGRSRSRNIRTAWLIAMAVIILSWLIVQILFALLHYFNLGLEHEIKRFIEITALALPIFFSCLTYFIGHDFVLLATNARRLNQFESAELFRLVGELCQRASLPMPELHLLPETGINCLAAGMRSDRAILAVSRGFLNKLSTAEKKAALAFCVSSIARNEIAVHTMMSVLAGFLLFARDALFNLIKDHFQAVSFKFSLTTPLTIFKLLTFLIGALIASIVFFLMGSIHKVIQLFISQTRELKCDLLALKINQDPIAYQSALEKIATDSEPWIYPNRACEHMFIMSPDPLRRQNANKSSLWFSSQAPLNQRLAVINSNYSSK